MGGVLRTLGLIALGLAAVVAVAGAAIGLNAERRLHENYGTTAPSFAVTLTPELVSRGAYQVTAFPGCAGCHSSNPQASPPVLDGNLVADLLPLGRFYAPNLTPGGKLAGWSDGQILRAMREGIAADGRGLAVMPADDYRHLSDDDARAIIAYLRSQPAVMNDTPLPRLSPLGRLLVGTGQVGLSVQPAVQDVTAPPRGPTAAYGGYLSAISGCGSCHGAQLDGQNIPPGPPKGPSLRVVKGWTDGQFIRAMREGVDPSEHQIDAKMPWQQYGRGTDEDLQALFAYLLSLP